MYLPTESCMFISSALIIHQTHAMVFLYRTKKLIFQIFLAFKKNNKIKKTHTHQESEPHSTVHGFKVTNKLSL